MENLTADILLGSKASFSFGEYSMDNFAAAILLVNLAIPTAVPVHVLCKTLQECTCRSTCFCKLHRS